MPEPESPEGDSLMALLLAFVTPKAMQNLVGIRCYVISVVGSIFYRTMKRADYTGEMNPVVFVLAFIAMMAQAL